MTSGGNSTAERNDTVKNKKKTNKEQLDQLRKKWNMNCQTAIRDKVAYVLRRSRTDYLRVFGSERGLNRYQAEVLEDVSGVGTHREVAIYERNRVANIVRDAFVNVEPDTITGLIGADIVAELLGEFQASIISVSPDMIVTRSDEKIENMNFTNGAVPAPVSAMSHVSAGASMGAAITYGYDPTSPTNIYTRDMLKAAGHIANDRPLTLDAFNEKFRAGLKKVQSLDFKKVGATLGALSAVTLISLGTSVSAYAAVGSYEMYYINHLSDTTWEDAKDGAQSLKVSADAPAPSAGRSRGIYQPDMIWPTVGGSSVTISSGFGYRIAPCAMCSSDHRGLDMNPGYGTEIYSSTSGRVLSVGWNGSLGWEVSIADEGNRVYVYGHMIANSSPADVVVGAKVKQGQVIGLVGSTGTSTGAHLHFEIHEDGVKIDPYPELQRWAH
jgi:murein DD-endopeptidase MepM/ murein hydrolase activator NlpD